MSKRADVIPLDCVKLAACSVSLCLSVFGVRSSLRGQTVMSCLCVRLPFTRRRILLTGVFGWDRNRRRQKNKRCQIFWGVDKNSLWNLGSQKWMLEQQRWSLETVGVHLEFNHIHANLLLLFLIPEDISNFLSVSLYTWGSLPILFVKVLVRDQ